MVASWRKGVKERNATQIQIRIVYVEIKSLNGMLNGKNLVKSDYAGIPLLKEKKECRRCFQIFMEFGAVMFNIDFGVKWIYCIFQC